MAILNTIDGIGGKPKRKLKKKLELNDFFSTEIVSEVEREYADYISSGGTPNMMPMDTFNRQRLAGIKKHAPAHYNRLVGLFDEPGANIPVTRFEGEPRKEFKQRQRNEQSGTGQAIESIPAQRISTPQVKLRTNVQEPPADQRYVAPAGEGFSQAFAKARQMRETGGPTTFIWNGTEYNTDLASERQQPKRKAVLKTTPNTGGRSNDPRFRP